MTSLVRKYKQFLADKAARAPFVYGSGPSKLTFHPHPVFIRCFSCVFCGRALRHRTIPRHLRWHDRASERKRLRDAGVGSFTVPLAGQLTLGGIK